MKKKRILSAILTLAIAAGAVTGCSSADSSSQGEADDKEIKVGIFDMGTLYLMQTFDEMGYYDKNGANVSFEYFPVYSDAMTAFNTSNVDMICYACAEAVSPAVNDIDCKIIGVFDTSYGLDGIAAVDGINTVADLKGKNVATEIGSVDHLLLQQALAANGLGESDINLVNMSAGDAVAAMAGGSLDAASTWEPQLSSAAKSGSIIYSTKEAPDLIADVFVIHGKVLDEQYDNAKAILKTWFDCIEEYKAEPSKFAESAAKKGNLTVDEFYAIMDVTNLLSLEDNKIKFEKGTDDIKNLNVLLRTVGDFLYDGKLIEKQLTDDKINEMIDSRIIDDLLKS
ncbi:MAG: ABC transporter substrate-binding protein [Ruminiclostridium sp.]